MALEMEAKREKKEDLLNKIQTYLAEFHSTLEMTNSLMSDEKGRELSGLEFNAIVDTYRVMEKTIEALSQYNRIYPDLEMRGCEEGLRLVSEQLKEQTDAIYNRSI